MRGLDIFGSSFCLLIVRGLSVSISIISSSSNVSSSDSSISVTESKWILIVFFTVSASPLSFSQSGTKNNYIFD